MIDFFGILDALSEMVYVTDTKTNEILYLNAEGKRLFGDCEGKLCSEVFDNPNGICCACPADKLSEDRIYTQTYRDSVTGRTYMLRDKLILWDGRKAKLEIAFDVTENERERSDLQMRLDVENFIVGCVLETHQTKPFHKAINTLLKTIGKFLDAERVYIFDYNGTTMSNTHEWCKEGLPHQIDTLQNMDAQIIDRWISEFKTGKLVMIEDIEKIKEISPREYEELSRRNVKCMMAAPLDNDGKIIGYMGVDNPPKEKIISGEMLFSVMSYFVSSVVIRDTTERKLLEISYTDTLTGMYNRNKFIEDTNKIADTEKTSIGVLYTDLNSLKEINDKYGHDAGDAVLKSVAGAVAETFGNDKVYRVGGDEFVVLCADIDEKEFSDKTEMLKKRLEILQYSSAIGYRYSDNSKDIDSIIKTADEEMYSDKKAFYKDRKEPGRYRARNDKAMVFAMPNSVKKIHQGRAICYMVPTQI
ncbi:MAG: sensor domain-containing diguanylate cyclase [Oscillospiraceae bacterium]|nr:sensor domain-containing diguanylate cyclase [Oscillospiraceae bacterium]